jgi:hypothetical protein
MLYDHLAIESLVITTNIFTLIDLDSQTGHKKEKSYSLEG